MSNSKETCVAVENYLTSALSLIDGIISSIKTKQNTKSKKFTLQALEQFNNCTCLQIYSTNPILEM